uniref:serine/threonine-protein kinase PINK1, mitochondrial-like isoform X1 n=1 Tax=Styela clava TaxID=7725 RepID=UPI00193A9969|nr:serine/threonine-protein kinase PINK1, mitochondrial-like isoform X1 [Styela clava]
MVRIANYFVKTQPHFWGRGPTTTIWEKFQRVKKTLQDAYFKTIRKQIPESTAELSQIVDVTSNVSRQQILKGYKTTISGYAARIQQQMSVRGGMMNGRAGPFNRDFLWRRLRTGHLFGFAALFLAHEENMEEENAYHKRMDDLTRLCAGIKDIFADCKYQDENIRLLPKLSGRISDFKLGKCIAVGCNGAVYGAEVNDVSENVIRDDKNNTPTSIKKTSNIRKSKQQVKKTKSKKEFAVKMIFNYDSSDSQRIFRQTRSELITCGRGALASLSKDWQNGNRARMKRLPSHPNIMAVHQAIIDKVPEHSEFRTRHPSSLAWPVGFGRTSTMFLIMKRYECTLEEYLNKTSLSFQTKYLLALQLLQGISHLERNNVAHRDLKSNNILVEHDSNRLPRLIIGDFGCSFVPELKEDMIFPFPSSEYDIRDGNPYVQPPEISKCQPGSTSVLDYGKSDAWAAGLLLCEIFGIERKNLYDDIAVNDDNRRILFMKELIQMMLMENPKERMSCTVAASVLHLELFGPIFETMNEKNSENSQHHSNSGFEVTITDWLLLHASETFAYRSTKWGKNSIICDVFMNYLSSLSLDGVRSAFTAWQSLHTY